MVHFVEEVDLFYFFLAGMMQHSQMMMTSLRLHWQTQMEEN